MEEFIEQAGLPDPRLADDSDHLTVPSRGFFERAAQVYELVVAAHKAR